MLEETAMKNLSNQIIQSTEAADGNVAGDEPIDTYGL